VLPEGISYMQRIILYSLETDVRVKTTNPIILFTLNEPTDVTHQAAFAHAHK